MSFRKAMLLLLLAGVCTAFFAQATGDYRSKATGNWNALTTWERYDGSSWVEPTAVQGTPTNSSGVITIISPNVVTVSANVQADQLTVNNGAQITVNTGIVLTIADGSGTDMTVNGTVQNAGTITPTGTIVFSSTGKYIHNWPAGTVGTIPTSTWSDGSVCQIINMAGTGTTTKLQGTSQSFYDFIWNCTSQSQSVYIRGDSFRPVRHDFKMQSTGTSNLEVSGVEGGPTWRLDFTNYIQTGGTFTITRNMSGAPNYTMNVAGNFSMSGGTLTTSAAYAILNFNGTSGTQTFTKSAGTLSGTINFAVANGSTLDVGTSVITGSGTFTLNSGASLITANANGITSSGASGSIQVTGTRTYNSGANYTYNGTVAQATGNGLTGANNLTINNSAGVTFSGGVTVSGVVTQTSGAISGTTPSVDGYTSPNLIRLVIAEDGTQMTGYSASTSVGSNMPQKIDRQWAITGSFAGNKTCTFYWDAADDGFFNWNTIVPSVYKGNTEYTQTGYDVVSDPRWVTVSIPSFDAKANFTIGAANDETLPVELTTFTATMFSDCFVRLHWVAQTEINHSGYNLYRAEDGALTSAMKINSRLIDNGEQLSSQISYTYTDFETFSNTQYYYWLESVSLDGMSQFFGPLLVTIGNPEQEPQAPENPLKTSLLNAFPNPFNPTTNLRYSIKTAGDVHIDVFNLKGQLIRSFSASHYSPGYYQVSWDGKDNNGALVSSGIYMYRMTTGSFSATKRMILAK